VTWAPIIDQTDKFIFKKSEKQKKKMDEDARKSLGEREIVPLDLPKVCRE
jgi:DNA-directed RNA polymerase